MIYGVTGMPLAGKTTVAGLIENKGFHVVDMGDVVRKEMEERDIPIEKTGEWVNKQREGKGMDGIAQLTAPYIEEDTDDIVITGMRSLNERKRFEEDLNQNVEMIAVWASPETRKKRREKRLRAEDVKGDGFIERDERELNNGVGKLMALSDYLIVNEEDKLDRLRRKVENVVN